MSIGGNYTFLCFPFCFVFNNRILYYIQDNSFVGQAVVTIYAYFKKN